MAAKKRKKASDPSPRPSRNNTRDRPLGVSPVKQGRGRSKPRGPAPSVTLEVVKRVSARVGRGLTLSLALAAEDCPAVNVENWNKTLQRHKELSTHYEAGKGQFLDMATERLVASEELANLRWLLERRFPDLFSKPEPGVTVNASVNLAIPPDVVERAREIAAEHNGPLSATQSEQHTVPTPRGLSPEALERGKRKRRGK